MYVYILYLLRKILRYPFFPQHLLTTSILFVFLIVHFGISFLFRYFGFVSVNLGTVSYQKPFVFSVSVFCSQIFTLKLNLWPKIGLTYAISIYV